MSWSPQQYLEFEDERTRPVRDLLAAVPRLEARRAADLGCGPGNSTEILARRFPMADILGLDSSPEMIAAARARLPKISFEVDEIRTWRPPTDFDVILSNAALQWVPDHATLLPQLLTRLAPGGCLAIQMPDNLDEPCQRLMREVAAAGPWAAKLTQAARSRTARASWAWYHQLLREHARRVDIWRTTYVHALPGGADAIVEWFKGSGLRPFLAPLSPKEQADYLAAYKAAILEAYPPLPDGLALLPFPRLFAVAVR